MRTYSGLTFPLNKSSPPHWQDMEPKQVPLSPDMMYDHCLCRTAQRF